MQVQETPNRFRYDGRSVLVVGCFSGMGAATSAIVRSLGGEVHGVDYRSPDHSLTSFTACDLRDVSQIGAMLDRLPAQLDAIFYCAGLFRPDAPLDVMTVNFIALRQVVDGLAPRLRAGSAIAAISSVAGLEYVKRPEVLEELLATPDFESARQWCAQRPDVVANGYQLSKEAVMAFMMARSMDLVGQGVRFNCLSPGRTDTPLIRDVEQEYGVEAYRSVRLPMDRYSTPEEQGWPLAFLNSDAASYMTGANLVVDGGLMASVTSGRSTSPQAALASQASTRPGGSR